MKYDRWHHSHPITIIFNLKQFFFLLILPLIRGIYSGLQKDGFEVWKNGTRYDLMVFLLMVLGSISFWFMEGFKVEGNFLILKAGIVRQKITRIPMNALSTMVHYQAFYLRPLSATYCEFFTGGGIYNEENGIYLTKTRAEDLRELWVDKEPPEDVQDFSSEIGFRNTVVLAIALNNSFGGLILLITFFQNVKKIANERIEQAAQESFSFIISFLERFLPATLTTVSLLLLAGLILGFLQQFFRYLRLSLIRHGRLLKINNGFFSLQHSILATEKINYVYARQGIILWFLRWQLTFVGCIGYRESSKKGDPILLAIEKTKSGWRKVGKILPELKKTKTTLKPDLPHAYFSFFWQAGLGLLGVLIFGLITEHILPDWSTMTLILCLILAVPFLWMAAIKSIDIRRSGAGFEQDCYTIKTSTFLSIITVILPKSRIAHVKFRQNPNQKRYGLVTVHIYPYRKSRKKFVLRQIPLEEAQVFFGNPE